MSMKIFLSAMILVSGVLFLGLIFGIGFSVGYNYFHNKTKKVCDLCFREIKKVNKLFNEADH